MDQEKKQEIREYALQLTKILLEHSAFPQTGIVNIDRLGSEWYAIETDIIDDGHAINCLCGKENIKKIHTIKNIYNNEVLNPIGSSCIKRFEIKPLDISCAICFKSVPDNNKFIVAYMKHRKITLTSSIICHKNCAKRYTEKFRLYGRYGYYLDKIKTEYLKSLDVMLCCDKIGRAHV